MNIKFIFILSSSFLTFTFTYTFSSSLPLTFASESSQLTKESYTSTAATAASFFHTVPRQRAVSDKQHSEARVLHPLALLERHISSGASQGESTLSASRDALLLPSASSSASPTPLANPKRALLLSPANATKKSPSPLPTRKKKVKPSPVSGSKRDKEEIEIFRKKCPTAKCKARLSDCVNCLDGVSLGQCLRFTRLVFGVSGPEYQNTTNITEAELQLKKKQLRALAKLLKRATPKSDSTYCSGFISRYATIRKLDIGDAATINSFGLGNILRDELFRRFGERVNVTSSVIYALRNVTYGEDDEKSAKNYTTGKSTSSSTSDSNANGSTTSSTTTTTTTTSSSSSSSTTTKTGLENIRTTRNLQGQLRLPTAAKQVLYANGKLRVWKIRQILKTLPRRDDWSSVFNKSPGDFKIRTRKGKVFLVFIGFNNKFQEQH